MEGLSTNPLCGWKFTYNFWLLKTKVVPQYPQGIGSRTPADNITTEAHVFYIKWRRTMHTASPLHHRIPITDRKQHRYLLKKVCLQVDTHSSCCTRVNLCFINACLSKHLHKIEQEKVSLSPGVNTKASHSTGWNYSLTKVCSLLFIPKQFVCCQCLGNSKPLHFPECELHDQRAP